VFETIHKFTKPFKTLYKTSPNSRTLYTHAQHFTNNKTTIYNSTQTQHKLCTTLHNSTTQFSQLLQKKTFKTWQNITNYTTHGKTLQHFPHHSTNLHNIENKTKHNTCTQIHLQKSTTIYKTTLYKLVQTYSQSYTHTKDSRICTRQNFKKTSQLYTRVQSSTMFDTIINTSTKLYNSLHNSAKLYKTLQNYTHTKTMQYLFKSRTICFLSKKSR